MNEFDRQRLDAIAAGQRPPKTPAEERVREQEEAGAILRRCMNNAREEALSLRKQLDAAQAEIERLNTTINDASLGIEFTLQQRFSGNLDEWDQATRTQLTNIMNGLDEAFDQ